MASRVQLASILVVLFAVGTYYLSLVVSYHHPSPQFVPKSLNLLSATTHDLLQQLESGSVTSVQLVSEYRRRVARDNRAGFWLNAVLSSAPEDIVLKIAAERDEQRRIGKTLGPLHGIPFVVKDNMVTDPSRGMKTTYGSYALQDAVAPQLAFIVEQAEAAGAIVIGKTNLQELGGFKGYNNQGWSRMGGRTVSPYDFGEPCDSSNGAGVSVSAGFSPIAFATDTTGSVSCPAAFNALYGLRPTLGLISRTGILPTTTSFDTPGVIAKSVADIALWMDVIAKADRNDPVTTGTSIKRSNNYSQAVTGKWRNWRIGVLDRGVFWNESLPLWTTDEEAREMIKTCNATLDRYHVGGATIVENIDLPLAHLPPEDPDLYNRLLRYELRRNLDAYFASLQNTSIHSIKDLVAWNEANPKLAYAKGYEGQEWLELALNTSYTKEEYLDLQNKRASIVSAGGIEAVMDKHNLDAVVVPAFTWLVLYNALSSVPFGVVPVGQYPFGRPFGLGFAARRFDDEKLLEIMGAIEKTSPPRIIPDVFKYDTTWNKMKYWWRRVKTPPRSPDNRKSLVSSPHVTA